MSLASPVPSTLSQPMQSKVRPGAVKSVAYSDPAGAYFLWPTLPQDRKNGGKSASWPWSGVLAGDEAIAANAASRRRQRRADGLLGSAAEIKKLAKKVFVLRTLTPGATLSRCTTKSANEVLGKAADPINTQRNQLRPRRRKHRPTKLWDRRPTTQLTPGAVSWWHCGVPPADGACYFMSVDEEEKKKRSRSMPCLWSRKTGAG